MMTVVHLVDVADRYRGYLSTVGMELSAGLYICPMMTKGVRERVWATIEDWWQTLPGGSAVMVWREAAQPGEIGLLSLGHRRYALVEIDGLILVRTKTSI